MRRLFALVLFGGMLAGYGSAFSQAFHHGGHCSRGAHHADDDGSASER